MTFSNIFQYKTFFLCMNYQIFWDDVAFGHTSDLIIILLSFFFYHCFHTPLELPMYKQVDSSMRERLNQMLYS